MDSSWKNLQIRMEAAWNNLLPLALHGVGGFLFYT